MIGHVLKCFALGAKKIITFFGNFACQFYVLHLIKVLRKNILVCSLIYFNQVKNILISFSEEHKYIVTEYENNIQTNQSVSLL